MDDQNNNLRVSDAERQEMTDYLQEAMSRGFITADELSERLTEALQAKTRGELVKVVRDLPDAPGAAPARRREAVGGDEATLRGTFGSVKRNGTWVVPATLNLRGRLASFELDFTDARIDYPVVTIDVDLSGGSLEMRLPPGSGLSIDDVETTLGSIEDKRKDYSRDGDPLFVIRGVIRMGSIEVRGPRKKWFGNS